MLGCKTKQIAAKWTDCYYGSLVKFGCYLCCFWIVLMLNPSKALTPTQTLNQLKTQLNNQLIQQSEQLINTQTNKWLKGLGQGHSRFVIEGIARENPTYTLESIQPLSELVDNPPELSFVQAAVFSVDNQGARRPALNLGLGQRYLAEDEQAILGVNLFLDYEGKSKHKRASLGLEYQRSNFGLNVNRYYPLSDKKVIGDYTEQPLYGYDLNLYGQMPYTPWAELKAKHYYWDQIQSEDIKGSSLGIELSLNSNMKLELGRSDNSTQEVQSYARLNLKLPFDAKPKATNFGFDDQAFRPSARMNLATLDWVEREQKIWIEKRLSNTAPVFSSASSASVLENQTSAITLLASDEQDITYSISDGVANEDDGEFFNVDAVSGVVTFKQAPDYENKQDFDQDNTYRFTAIATDEAGLNSSYQVLISVLDEDERGVVFSGLNNGSLTLSEGTSGQYGIVLASPPTAEVIINISHSESAALTLLTSNLVFDETDWSTPKFVEIQTHQDDDVNNEQIEISYGIAGGGYDDISIDTTSINVTDDDQAGFTFNPLGDRTSEDGDSVDFTVVLNTRPSANVIVITSTEDASEGATSKSQLTFKPDNWSVAQTVTVTGVNDNLVDGDQAYKILLMVSASEDNDYKALSAQYIDLINVDNNTFAFTIGREAGEIDDVTAETKSSGFFQVALGSKPSANVVLNLLSSDETEGKLLDSGTEVSSISLTFTPDNWNQVQRVNVIGMDDNLDDDNQVYHILSSSVTSSDENYHGLNLSVQMTNMDNDSSGHIYTVEGQDADIYYISITSPHTQRIWLDRNLGAGQACSSSNDANCYGYLYQWGRDDDRHEHRDSHITLDIASTIYPNDAAFVVANSSPFDWTSADDMTIFRSSAWNDNGNSDICPVGFRVPTRAEWLADSIDASTSINNSSSAFSSFLKLPAAGYRSGNSATLLNVGNTGQYWTWDALTGNAYNLYFSAGSASMGYSRRANGYSVRCINR